MVVADLDGSLLPCSTERMWIAMRRPDLYRPLTTLTSLERSTRAIKFSKWLRTAVRLRKREAWRTIEARDRYRYLTITLAWNGRRSCQDRSYGLATPRTGGSAEPRLAARGKSRFGGKAARRINELRSVSRVFWTSTTGC